MAISLRLADDSLSNSLPIDIPFNLSHFDFCSAVGLYFIRNALCFYRVENVAEHSIEVVDRNYHPNSSR